MEERRSLPPYEDELSLALLRSAEHDEPSAAAYSKVATALGVSAAVGLGASVPVQAALASSGTTASAAARWSGSLLAKGALVGLSSALLVVSGVALLRHRSSASTAQPSAAHLASKANAPNAPSALPKSSVDPSSPSPAGELASAVPAPTPKPSETATPAAAPVVPSALTPSAPNAAASNAVRSPKKSSLPEQVLSLDRARVALNSGDASAALAEIARYRNTWPRGVFLTEASVLEIEALARRGEIVLAGMRAQAFVTAHPDSPQAERLRALIPGVAR
ncbi:MAG TPA: hypothetical protein VNW92_28065 [Polyangiaceae bacterium]|jgi:hypothetical protein|nr:hypothetical protein [Polyangiaceae bacterium]